MLGRRIIPPSSKETRLAKSENPIVATREDVAVFRAVLDAGVTVTDSVFKGVWQWFPDVELMVPLQAMALGDQERAALASQILGEMDEVFSVLENLWDHDGSEDDLARGSKQVDALFRELASCYSDFVNAEVHVLPDEVRVVVEESMIERLMSQMDTDEDTVRYRLKNDAALRMMLRMSGLDPDKVL